MIIIASLSLIIILIQCYFINGTSHKCSELSVSSSADYREIGDVVENGVVQEQWTNGSNLMKSSQQIDYFYVKSSNLENKNIQLIFDDHFFANSTVSIQNIVNIAGHKKLYSIEVKYRCNKYGGALINYQLGINFPECGTTRFFWKKVCGEPLIPRDGLSMDIQIKKFNQTIVQNGILKNASYFDNDLDSLVFRIPSQFAYTQFFLYMDIQNKNSDNQNSAALSNSPDESVPDELEILREVLMMIPEEQLEEPFVEADQLVLDPILKGDFARGGKITQDHRSLILDYNCKSKGTSTIQLTIPLKYFRDIKLFFIKECPNNVFGEIKDVEDKLGFLFFMFLILILAIVFTTAYNIFMKNKTGIEAVPYAKQVILYTLRYQSIRTSWAGIYLSKISGLYFIPDKIIKNDDYDRESDFKLGELNNNNSNNEEKQNLSSKYGSL